MIWHDGRLIEAGDLRVGVEDRVFEHGLGLFETFRSWDGRAPLLSRHLARLRASSEVLGIPLEGVALPDQDAVAALLETFGRGDALLRLTITGGTPDGGPPVAWLAARPLPPPEALPLSVRVERDSVGRTEGRVHRFKMLNYWGRRVAHETAEGLRVDELLLCSREGWLLEGSRNNVLVVTKGRSGTIATPSLQGPVLPGIMRRVALDFAISRDFEVEERIVDARELADAETIYLTNSVRGVRPVGRVDDRPVSGTAAAELTRLFAEELLAYILSQPDPALLPNLDSMQNP